MPRPVLREADVVVHQDGDGEDGPRHQRRAGVRVVQRLRHGQCSWPRWRKQRSAPAHPGASSMVVYGEGSYTCRSPGAVQPARTVHGGSAYETVRTSLPTLAKNPLAPNLVDEDTPLRPRRMSTRRPRSHKNTSPSPGRTRPDQPPSRCASTTSTALACHATRHSPGSRPSSAPTSKRRTTTSASRTARQRRLHPRRRRRRGQRSRRGPPDRPPAARPDRLQHRLRTSTYRRRRRNRPRRGSRRTRPRRHRTDSAPAMSGCTSPPRQRGRETNSASSPPPPSPPAWPIRNRPATCLRVKRARSGGSDLSTVDAGGDIDILSHTPPTPQRE